MDSPNTVEILIADDDPNTKYLVETFCRNRADLDLHFVANGQEALELMSARSFDAVVTDLRMPVMSGDELLSELKRDLPTIPVLVMTSYGSIEDAVDYLQRGADDYLAKPLTRDAFLHRLDRVIDRLKLTNELRSLREKVANRPKQFIAKSPSMLKIMARVPTIAQTEASVVIYRESGTGKEVIAREINELSRRADKPWVAVNCGSLPEGLLESELFGYKKGAFTGAETDNTGLVEEAHTGTLFLDEIGEIPLAIQVKLLRFLQLKEYKPLGSPKSKIADVRIITATNRDLAKAVAEGSFREDLYYRLNIVPIHLPRLADRSSDIPILAAYFLEKFNTRFNRNVAFSETDVLRRLEAHNWPGNVRELENKIEQLAVMAVSDSITPDDVQFVQPPPGAMSWSSSSSTLQFGFGTFKEEKQSVLRKFEKDYLTRLLIAENGHVTQAAARAGMDRKNLWQLLKRHELSADDYRN